MIQYFEIDQAATQAFVLAPPAPRQKAYHEIIWIQKGRADFMIDGDSFSIQANAFFILPKDRYHQFLPKEAISGQVIRFTEEELDSFPRFLFSKFNDLSQVYLDTPNALVFELLYKALKIEYTNDQKSTSVLIHLIKAIIVKLNDVKKQQLPGCEQQHTSIDIFDQFQLLLDQHIRTHRTVGFYANLLNISARKLGQGIRLVMNNTTESIIAQRLLIEAKRELSYTDKTVSEIAYDLNFQDNSYFTKFFKKWTNTTPKAFRKLNITK